MTKAIIFDCFGVIITDGLQILCDELAQRDPASLKEVRALIHAANKGIISPNESTPQVAAILGISVEEYRRKVRSNEVRNQQLLSFIKTLRPKYKVGMLSNITTDGLSRRFPNNELADYFDVVTISSEIGYAKPDPEAYLVAAERLDTDPRDCLFIDDREPYCIGAREVQMKAICYVDYHQFQSDFQQALESA